MNPTEDGAGSDPGGDLRPGPPVAIGEPVVPGPGLLQSVSGGLLARGTPWMVVGAALAALGAYLFQAIGTRSLGGVGYAPIGALWTIQYLVVSIVLFPLETFITRQELMRRGRRAGAREAAFSTWGWVGGIAVGLTILCWTLRERLFHGLADLALVVGLLVISYAAFIVVRGMLAGTERFKAYGLVTASESLTRALIAVPMALLVGTTRALAWIMPVGALVAAGWWPVLRRRTREPREVPVEDSPARRPLRFLVLTTATHGIVQLLLAGGPLLMVFLGAAPGEFSILFVTLTAARVPIVFAFSGALSRLLSTFMRLEGADGGGGLRRTAVAIGFGTFGVAVLAGAAAAAIGGPLIALLFGRPFTPPWWMAAGATFGVLLASGSMVLNHVLVAQRSERRALVAWILALGAAITTVLASSGSASGRVMAAFVIAEAVALAGLVVAAARPRVGQDQASGQAIGDQP